MKRLLGLLLLLLAVLYVGVKENLITLSDKFELPIKNIPVSDTLKTEDITIVKEESAIINAIDSALPSVVTIRITRKQSLRASDLFFGLDDPSDSESVEQSIGSGFVIAKNLVVTNKHVANIPDAKYQIVTNDKKTFDVVEISSDPLNDLAILKIKTDMLKPIKLGNSSQLKLGQVVIAIGTPLGEFPNTVTTGIVSGLGRGITAGSPYEGFVERLDDVIQTDAAINPGNSGGPLLNSKGEVIGINTAVSTGSQNIGFAIPVNILTELVANYTSAGGKIQRPYLGVRYKMITEQSAILNDVPQGAYVVEILENSPAEKAGFKVGDIITDFDGNKVTETDDTSLQKKIAKKKIGDKVNVSIWRDSKKLQLTITLEVFK